MHKVTEKLWETGKQPFIKEKAMIRLCPFLDLRQLTDDAHLELIKKIMMRVNWRNQNRLNGTLAVESAAEVYWLIRNVKNA